jgi:hypothetical protein
VTYGEGPKGWKFTTNNDGYTVKGPAVKAGVNAEYSVVVKQLPDAKDLAFKTLQSYSDGRTDRWIELDESGENPAPVLQLKAAAPDATPISPCPTASESPSPTPTPEETTASATPQAADTETDDDGGLSGGTWTGIIAAILVVAAAVAFFVRRRGAAQ